MRAEREVEAPPLKDVWKVSQWKTAVDPTEPWWRRAFHKYIYLPFQDLSFGVMKVPTVKEVIVESDDKGHVRRTFRWFEDEGIFETEEQADAGCLGEQWGYKRMPFGRLMPVESSQYSGTVFPRKKNPKKWSKPVLSLVTKNRKEEEREKQALAECLTELNHVLDRR
jgi:hypothetical protein